MVLKGYVSTSAGHALGVSVMASKRLGRSSSDISGARRPQFQDATVGIECQKGGTISRACPCWLGYTRPKNALPNATSDALEAIDKCVPAGRVVARIVTVLFALACLFVVFFSIHSLGQKSIARLSAHFVSGCGGNATLLAWHCHRNLRIMYAFVQRKLSRFTTLSDANTNVVVAEGVTLGNDEAGRQPQVELARLIERFADTLKQIPGDSDGARLAAQW